MPPEKLSPSWASRPDENIRAALLLSLLAHLAVFAFWKLPVPPIAMEGQKVLTVILPARPQAKAPESESPPEPEIKAILPLPEPVPASPPTENVKPPEPNPGAREEEQHVTLSPPTAEVHQPMNEEAQSLPADPVVEIRNPQVAQQAQAVLLIGADGKVGQIIWTALPAVSDEELRLMEMRLRQGIHLARGESYTIQESIEIPRGEQ